MPIIVPPVDESDEDERIKLQLVFKSQFCNVHGMSRIDDDDIVRSELLQFVIAGLNVIAPPRLVNSCSTILPPAPATAARLFAWRGRVFVGVALKP